MLIKHLRPKRSGPRATPPSKGATAAQLSHEPTPSNAGGFANVADFAAAGCGDPLDPRLAHSGIRNLRKGTKSPGIENVLELASILKTSSAYLFLGSGEDLAVVPQRSRPFPLPVIGDVAAGV